jgi:hypothetical protein
LDFLPRAVARKMRALQAIAACESFTFYIKLLSFGFTWLYAAISSIKAVSVRWKPSSRHDDTSNYSSSDSNRRQFLNQTIGPAAFCADLCDPDWAWSCRDAKAQTKGRDAV